MQDITKTRYNLKINNFLSLPDILEMLVSFERCDMPVWWFSRDFSEILVFIRIFQFSGQGRDSIFSNFPEVLHMTAPKQIWIIEILKGWKWVMKLGGAWNVIYKSRKTSWSPNIGCLMLIKGFSLFHCFEIFWREHSSA